VTRAPLVRPVPAQPSKPSRVRAVLVASLSALTLGMGSGAWAEVPYQLISDFESGGLAPWQPSTSPTGWSMKVERGNARAGAYALHFVLERKDSNSYRAEATVDDQNPQGYSGRFHWDTEYWLGMSIQLVDWIPDVGSIDFFLQLHGLIPHDKDRKRKNCMNANALSFVARSKAPGSWQLRVQNTAGCPVGTGALAGARTAWRGPVDDAWVDWVFNLRLSPGNDGFTRIWRDGTLVYDYTGPNVRSHFRNCCQEIPPRERQHYLKIGPYKPPWQKRPSSVETRELWMDEIRIGNVKAGYNAGYLGVAPGTRGAQAQGEARGR
jgi:hypothetical protein